MELKKINFESLGIYEKILDMSNEGVNVVNTNGILIYVNKVSAEYCNSTQEDMIGSHITNFYPNAMLLSVLKNKHAILNEKIHYVGIKRYVCSSFPIYNNDEFIGAFSVFRDVREIDDLNKKVKYLELQVNLNKPEDKIESVVGYGDTLNSVFNKAKKTVGSLGGPRHSIITGQSGTGKTMLANLIYNYAKQVGVISKNAPFIEINCAQFTNPDIAAMEIFGSEEGAYTGSKKKKGLFEQANGGILFLDEAHTLENYQNMLLKAIESGKIRRIGGISEIDINVIIIAASTRNLHEVLLPELYQRLGQYEMYLPSLNERTYQEKEMLFNHFITKYEAAVKKSHNIDYYVSFEPEAKKALLNAVYPRNIRQFRDIINYSIDSSSPLIEDIKGLDKISTLVTIRDIPFEIIDNNEPEIKNINTDVVVPENNKYITPAIENEIKYLHSQNLGPRRISKKLEKMGYNIPYYKIAYFLKNSN